CSASSSAARAARKRPDANGSGRATVSVEPGSELMSPSRAHSHGVQAWRRIEAMLSAFPREPIWPQPFAALDRPQPESQSARLDQWQRRPLTNTAGLRSRLTRSLLHEARIRESQGSD